MPDFEITGPYLGALMMSLGALCLFIWGVFSGALRNTEEASRQFYEREMENDGRSPNQPGERKAS
jgi:HAMP domain-containing protein